MNGSVIEMVRDCDALLIPNGIPVTLRQGESVMITQAIGGNYTVSVRGNLARVDAKDVDAFGLDPEMMTNNSFVIPEQLSEESVWEVLSTCYDPEIPVNIVELGLIYALELKEDKVFIQMTLTSPGCGMGPILVSDVKQRVEKIPGLREVDVELTFDPPWNQALMSEAAKLELGFL